MSFRVYNSTTHLDASVAIGGTASIQVRMGDTIFFTGSGWEPYQQVLIDRFMNAVWHTIATAQTDQYGGFNSGSFPIQSEVGTMPTRAMVGGVLSGTINLVSASVKMTVNIQSSGPGTTSPSGTIQADVGAAIPLIAYADDGAYFIKWTANGVDQPWGPSVTAYPQNGDTIIAYFSSTYYTLTLNTTGGGVGYINNYPYYTHYLPGQVVRLTANPEAGSAFGGWSGSISGTTNPIDITMNSNKTITATFNKTSYILTIEKDGTGTGTVTASPLKPSYNLNEAVSLQANPASGSTFVKWSGAVIGSQNPGEVIMTGDKTVTATFASSTPPPEWKLIVRRNPPEGGRVSTPEESTWPADPVYHINIGATPAEGYTFKNWTGSVVSNENPILVTMDANKTITANFIRNDVKPPIDPKLIIGGMVGVGVIAYIASKK